MFYNHSSWIFQSPEPSQANAHRVDEVVQSFRSERAARGCFSNRQTRPISGSHGDDPMKAHRFPLIDAMYPIGQE